MKTSRLAIIALMALGLTACNKDPKHKDDPIPDGKEMSFTVSAEDAAWKSGDELLLFDGTASQKIALQGEGSQIPFTATVAKDAESFLAYYPYSSAVKPVSVTVVEDELSASQTAAENAFPSEGIKYCGSANGAAITMSPIFGYLKFQVEEEGYTSFAISGNDSEVLAGAISVNCASAIPSVSAKGSEKTVTLTAKDGFKAGVWYYIAVIPQALKSGASCTLSGAGKDARTLNTSDKLSAGIGQIAELGTVKAPKPKVDYYSLTLNDFVWSTSNVYYVKNASSETVAMVAREYFGSVVKGQGIVVYPMVSGKPDYTKGSVAQVTKVGNTDPGEEALNIHGGTISMVDMDPAKVQYTQGTSALSQEIYIKCSDSTVYFTEPDDLNAVAVTVKPLVVTTDVKDHPVAKVGTHIWLGGDLQTTKYNDGTSIPKYENGGAMWAAGTPALVVYNNGTADYYVYNGYALGYSNSADGELCSLNDKISPEGWRLPTADEYVGGLCAFCGNDLDVLKNLSNIKAANCYKAAASSGKVKISSLGYTSSWTSTPSTAVSGTSKAVMCGLKGDGTVVNAPQPLLTAFSVRLIKE